MPEWKEQSRELYFQKFSRKIERVDFEMPDENVADFYIKKEGPAVAILALTPNQEVILVEQFRPGPMQTLWELPGGYVDSEESPEEAGKRELLEETGYTGDVSYVTECLDDAYSTMRRTAVVAQNCTPVQDQNLEQTEFGNIKLLNLNDFRELLRSGQMTDVEIGYLALDYLNLL